MNIRQLIGRLLWWFVEPVNRKRGRTFGDAFRTADGGVCYAIEDGGNSEIGTGRFVAGAEAAE